MQEVTRFLNLIFFHSPIPATVPPRVHSDGPPGAEADQSGEEGSEERLWRGEEGICAIYPPFLRSLLPCQWPEPHEHPRLQSEKLVSDSQLNQKKEDTFE